MSVKQNPTSLNPIQNYKRRDVQYVSAFEVPERTIVKVYCSSVAAQAPQVADAGDYVVVTPEGTILCMDKAHFEHTYEMI